MAELLAARRRRSSTCGWPRTSTRPDPRPHRAAGHRGPGARSRGSAAPGSTPRRAPTRPRACWPTPGPCPRPTSTTSAGARPAGPKPFLLALDGVTDPQNLGALLRSAEAAGATGAVLARHRAVHVTPTVAKAAAGAIEHVPMAVVGGMPAALARAKELGCWVVGLAGDGDQSLFDGLAVADEAIVLVVGAEGAGLSRLARARCDLVVSIPMRGQLRVAQRDRRRRARALRGQPATLRGRFG